MTRVGLPGERMDDQAFLNRFAAGDAEVGLTFVGRLQRRVYGIALAVPGDVHQAEQAGCVVMAGLYGRSASQVATAEGIPLATAKPVSESTMVRLPAVVAPREVSGA